jgi:5'-nucleotidase
VAAAVEGVVNGIPGIAFSLGSPASSDYTEVAGFAARLVHLVEEHRLPTDMFLNVNFPAVPWREVKGVLITRLGRRVYRDELVSRLDPRGRPYYWIGGEPPGGVADCGTDIGAVTDGYVSITPVYLDMTAYHFHEELKRWDIRLSEP